MVEERRMGNRLGGALILLLAGVPDYQRGDEELPDGESSDSEDQMIRVQEAVVSLSRAVFSAGGRLALEDDPLLTPLVAQLASEYWEPAPIETQSSGDERSHREREPVIVYQPKKIFSKEENFLQAGYVRVQSEMPSEVAAVVAIGGGEEQHYEFASWLERRGPIPIYVVGSTGGWASREGPRYREITEEANDEQLWQKLQSLRNEIRFPVPKEEFAERGEREPTVEEHVPEFRYSLYPLLMFNIVEDVAKRRG
jgi:hypothetical protein